MKTKKCFKTVLVFLFAATTGLMAQSEPLPQQKAPQLEVNDDELAKFAKAYQKIRVANQETQKEMVEIVEDKQFEIQRFNEIHKATLDPNTAEVGNVTPEEKENYTEAVKEIEELQPQFQKRMENAIKAQDLTVERYEKLVMALQSDASLQTRLQKMLQG